MAESNKKDRLNWAVARRFCVIFIVLLCIFAILGRFGSIFESRKVVRIYCASVLKGVVQESILAFEKAHDCDLKVEYGGSGALLERAKLSRVGDVYLAADRFYFVRGRADGVLIKGVDLGGMKLVLAVGDGNPKGVKNLDDFLKLNYVICDERAAAGFVLKSAMKKIGRYDAILKGAKAVKPTVSMLGADVKLGSVDGAIVWDVTARQFGLEVVEVEELTGVKGIAIGGVFEFSKEKALAGAFVAMLASKALDELFLENGFESID